MSETRIDMEPERTDETALEKVRDVIASVTKRLGRPLAPRSEMSVRPEVYAQLCIELGRKPGAKVLVDGILIDGDVAAYDPS